MMASGNPNWYTMQQQQQQQNNPLFSLLHHQLNLHGGGGPSNSPPSSSSSSSCASSSSSASSLPFNPLLDDQSLPQSWSQLLMGGISSGPEEEELGLNGHLQGMTPKITPNNENLLFGNDHHQQHQNHLIKQEAYGHHVHGHDMNQHHHEAMHHHQLHNIRPSTWSQFVSSPKSNVTTLSSNNSNLMDFSSNSCKDIQQCRSAPKKPRVQSPSIPPLKVRKEKLGDRITALHQLVSPFGKTDTASVLLETIGCIRFLQGQIQALSSPYLGNPPSKNHHFNYAVKDETLKDLGSRGLCLVPISCTQIMGSDNNTASEYWAPSITGGF